MRTREAIFALVVFIGLFAEISELRATATAPGPDQNPTSNTGALKSRVETGGGYDAHTGNASRSIPDLVVPNAPGDYGLDFTRHYNSLRSDVYMHTTSLGPLPEQTTDFGTSGWSHSWSWKVVYQDVLEEPYGDGHGELYRMRITITFPDGQARKFTLVRTSYFIWGQPWGSDPRFGPPYLPEHGEDNWTRDGAVHDGLQMSRDGHSFWLHRADGGSVYFECPTPGGYQSYQATIVYDPHGLWTKLHYDTGGYLRNVEQEGGRHLLIDWGTVCSTPVPPNNANACWSKVISQVQYVPVTGGAAAQTVTYQYSWVSHGALNQRLVLSKVSYLNEPAAGGCVKASYSYGDYTEPPGFYFMGPRLTAADDPHFAGPMSRIHYTYQQAGCAWLSRPLPPNEPYVGATFDYLFKSPTVVAAEKSVTDVPVSSFSIDCWGGTRLETNGLGGTRKFYFGHSAGDHGNYHCFGFELAKLTDFALNGNPTAPGVPSRTQNWYIGQPSETWDGRGIRTESVVTDASDQPGEVHFADGSAAYYDRVNPGNSAARDGSRISNPDTHWLFSSKDERGKLTTYRRDARRRVTDVTYPDGSHELYAYDEGLATALNLVTTHTLPSGAVEHFGYDSRGRLTSQWNSVDDSAHSTNYTYYGPFNHPEWADQVETMLEPRARGAGKTFSAKMEYNGRGQVTKVIYPATDSGADPFVTYEYDAYGNCTAVKNELGYRSTYTYDDYHRCTSYTEPLAAGGVARIWYWVYDRNVTGVGLVSAYAHTGAEWRLQIEPPLNAAGQHRGTARIHDVDNRITAEGTGYTVTGGSGNWVFTVGGQTEVRYFSYDENGQKHTSTDPLGRVTSYTYDNRNRLKDTIEPLNRTTTTLYDTTGNKTQVTFPDSRTQRWLNYTAFGQPGQFLDERNNSTEMTYKLWGSMKKLDTVTTHRAKDGGGTEDQPTQFRYDGMGRLRTTVFPDATTEVSEYDAGQVITFTTRRRQIKHIAYDARGREQSNSWASGAAPGITRGWDPAGRLSWLQNIYARIDYTYDYAGQMLSESNAIAGSSGSSSASVAKSTNYTRFPSGAVKSLTYPSGTTVNRAYTLRGQLQSVTWSGLAGGSATYSYLKDGKVDYSDYGNGLRNNLDYDGRGFPSLSETSRLSPVQSYTRRTYWRDARDRITAWKKSEDSRGDRYGYDAEGQLISAKYNALTPEGTPSAAARTDAFSYDALGNRQSVNYVASRGQMNFVRRGNGLNQYLWWGDTLPAGNPQHWGSNTYLDDNWFTPWVYPGNGVTMADGTMTASYNALNQPVAFYSPALPPGNFMFLGYDPLGRCVKRWVAPTSNGAGSNPATYFYYEGWNLLQEGASANAPGRVYVQGARVDEIVASCIWSGNLWAYHHYDARGHCILLTLPNGNVQEKYSYDAFGLPYFHRADGSAMPKVNGRPISAWGNRFLFTGREWLGEIGIYDFRNRLYQPELGRFMQPDPKEFAAGDYNLYRYCHNDPVNKSDPTGLYVTYTDNWSAADAEKFKKAFDKQWSTKEGRETWESRYNSKNEFRVSPDRTTGTKDQGASNFNVGEYGRKGILQNIKDAASSVLGMGQSNFNSEKGRQGDNTAKNKQAEQAADKERLSDTQREIYHDQIHGRDLPFNQLREEAAAVRQAYPGK